MFGRELLVGLYLPISMWFEFSKVNEIGATVDKETTDTSTPKVSYKDYLGLWEFLLEKDKFKVKGSAFHF